MKRLMPAGDYGRFLTATRQLDSLMPDYLDACLAGEMTRTEYNWLDFQVDDLDEDKRYEVPLRFSRDYRYLSKPKVSRNPLFPKIGGEKMIHRGCADHYEVLSMDTQPSANVTAVLFTNALHIYTTQQDSHPKDQCSLSLQKFWMEDPPASEGCVKLSSQGSLLLVLRRTTEWQAEVYSMEPEDLVSWRSRPSHVFSAQKPNLADQLREKHLFSWVARDTLLLKVGLEFHMARLSTAESLLTYLSLDTREYGRDRSRPHLFASCRRDGGAEHITVYTALECSGKSCACHKLSVNMLRLPTDDLQDLGAIHESADYYFKGTIIDIKTTHKMAVIVTFGGGDGSDDEPTTRCDNDGRAPVRVGRYHFFYSKNAEKPKLFHSSTPFDGPIGSDWHLDSQWSLTETSLCYINRKTLENSLVVIPAVIVFLSKYWLGPGRSFEASHMGRYDRVSFVSNAKILAARGTRLTEIFVGCFSMPPNQRRYTIRTSEQD